jgi:hypothetical protein
MKLIAEPDHLRPFRFIIERDEAVGFYLYVYENEYCVRDYLQDTLELAIEMASEDYQVPKEAWKTIS